LSTQFDTTTSTSPSAISGRVRRSSSAREEARRRPSALVTGSRARVASRRSRSSARSWIRPRRSSTLAYPSRSARIGALRRATSSISSVMSTPITRPSGPTTCAAMKQILPVPLPRSSTVSPGRRCRLGSPQP